MRNHGSAMLMVMLIMSAIIVSATITLRTVVYAYDLSLKRLEYAQHYYAADALLHYGTDVCRENYAVCCAHATPTLTLTFDPWLSSDNDKQYAGTVEIVRNTDGLLCKAQLFNKGVMCMTLQSTVAQPKPT
jgi:hypothetical protein